MIVTDTITALSTPHPEGKLISRVAFVTGGTRGIGAAISQSLARQGAAIAAGYAGNVARAEAFAEDFRSRHVDDGVKVTLHRGSTGRGPTAARGSRGHRGTGRIISVSSVIGKARRRRRRVHHRRGVGVNGGLDM